MKKKVCFAESNYSKAELKSILEMLLAGLTNINFSLLLVL